MKYLSVFLLFLAGCKHYECTKTAMVEVCEPDMVMGAALNNMAMAYALCRHEVEEQCVEYREIEE